MGCCGTVQNNQKRKENYEEQQSKREDAEGQQEISEEFEAGDDLELQAELGNKYLKNEANKEKKNQQEEGLFEEIPVDQGDQALAVKPFVGAIIAPTKPPQMKNEKPNVSLQLEYAYGYRSFDSRQNLFFTKDQSQIVYMTAAIGVVMNIKSNTQRFFGAGLKESTNGHSDDITALAIDDQRQLIATGEVGNNPKICVWKVDSPEDPPLAEFKQGRDSRGVTALAFSSCGKYLVASAQDNNHIVRVFDWQQNKKIAEEKNGPDKILDIAWHPSQDQFTSVGMKTIYIWTLGTQGFQGKKKGIFGKVAPSSNLTAVNYTKQGDAIVAGSNGFVYLFTGNTLKKAAKLHQKAIHSIRVIDDKVYSGGADNKIVVSSIDLDKKREISTESTPRSIDVNGEGEILVGLRNGSINLIVGNQISNLMKSHSDGEVWGLSFGQTPNIFVTSGDDNKILVWDLQTRKCIGSGIVNATPGPERKSGKGASTLSPLPPNQQSRAIAIHPKKGHVAIAINDGSWKVFAGVNNLNQEIAHGNEPKEWSQVMKYSPNGKYLALGSHDNNIYLYNADNNYVLEKVLKAHNSFIETLDFSFDNKYIKSTCGAYELLFFDVQTGKQDKSGAQNTRNLEWNTYSTKFGWHVQGIFQGCIDYSNINSVDRNHDQNTIVVGNDWRNVTLFGFPNGEGARGKEYKQAFLFQSAFRTCDQREMIQR